MAKYKVTAPAEEEFTGIVAGVAFAKSVAEVDDKEQAAALAYFRRRGYKVEKAGAASTAAKDDGGAPARSASKADWVAYATSTEGGMAEAEAEGMTRDQLADKFLGPKE